MTAALVLVAIAAMCIAAVSSGFEVGIYSLSRVRLRYRLAAGDRRAQALDGLLAKPEQLLSGLAVTQNMAIYCVTAIVSGLVERSGVRWAEVWSSLALAVVFFIFVEATPKNVFRRGADVLVYPLARPYSYIQRALAPAVLFLRGITKAVLGFWSKRETGFDQLFTRERLAFYMREGQSEGVLSNYQVELTHNILRGENVTVGRAMVPIADAAVVMTDAGGEELKRLAREKGHSRYPVVEEKTGKLAGIVNIYDCILVESGELDIREAMREPVYFGRDVHVTEALRALREARQPMGVVLGEAGAVGIVTVKDCVEEIVGELYEW